MRDVTDGRYILFGRECRVAKTVQGGNGDLVGDIYQLMNQLDFECLVR